MLVEGRESMDIATSVRRNEERGVNCSYIFQCQCRFTLFYSIPWICGEQHIFAIFFKYGISFIQMWIFSPPEEKKHLKTLSLSCLSLWQNIVALKSD